MSYYTDKILPTDTVFVFTPHGLFYGVVTEVRELTTPEGKQPTLYTVEMFDPHAGGRSVGQYERGQLYADEYSAPTDKWLSTVGKPAKEYADNLIAALNGSVKEVVS